MITELHTNKRMYRHSHESLGIYGFEIAGSGSIRTEVAGPHNTTPRARGKVTREPMLILASSAGREPLGSVT